MLDTREDLPHAQQKDEGRVLSGFKHALQVIYCDLNHIPGAHEI